MGQFDITPHEREHIITGYKLGKTIKRLMAETGRSYGGVHHTLERAGVTFRKRGREKTVIDNTTPRLKRDNA